MKFKFLFQKLFRKNHISEDYYWNLFNHLSWELFLKLYYFVKPELASYPATLNSLQEWKSIVGDMINSFALLILEEDNKKQTRFIRKHWPQIKKFDNYKAEEKYAVIQDGLNLFGKFFTALWD